MKTDEAIAILTGEVVTMGERGRELMDEAQKMGAKALKTFEIGAPPKVLQQFTRSSPNIYACDNCGRDIPYKHAYNFCPLCGKKIDWSRDK